MPWEPSVSTVALNTPDKRIALHKLLQIADEREKEHNGLIAPKPVREAAERPLLALLHEYLAELEARGRRPRTVRKYRITIAKLFQRCQWTKINHATPRSFTQWRAHCGLSGETLNDLLAATRGFFDWLERQRMLIENPLKHVERVDTRGKRQYRRGLTDDQLKHLVIVSPNYRGAIYLIAGRTGWRRHEMKQLRWSDLSIDCSEPFSLLPAAITKNRKSAKLPLLPDAVTALRSIRPPNVAPFQLVFADGLPNYRTFRKDLQRAGILVLSETGERVDFHALRATFRMFLHKNGVSLETVVLLMRHSDPRLAMREYLDVSQLALSQSISTLPSLQTREGQHAC
jgi:integrase